MMPLKVLAFAAISDRVGMVLLHGDQLKNWQACERATKSSVDAAAFVQEMINFHGPDVVVTERLNAENRKGKPTKRLIAAMEMVADQNYVLSVTTEHRHPYPCKYEEAMALAGQYPALKPWLPAKRRVFDHQPRTMVIFEALSLANSIARGSAEQLAAAM